MEDDDSSQILTILSWNVNGFSGKKTCVLGHIKLLKPDIIFLQETHLGPSTDLPPGSIHFQELGSDYSWAIFTVYKANSRGVAVLFRKDLSCEGLRVTGDKKGRYMIITCHILEKEFVFVNVYNPGDDKIEFDEDEDFKIIPPESGLLVIAGDFNTVLEAELDKTSSRKNKGHKDRLRGLQDFLGNFGLTDVWRCLHPEEKAFTYFGMVKRGTSRLDYFFVPENTMRRVAACEIHTRPQYSDKQDYLSDHAPISIQIRTADTRWELDSTLLWDEHCGEHFSDTIKHFSGKKKKKGDLWMQLKQRLRCEATAWKKRRSKERGERQERKLGSPVAIKSIKTTSEFQKQVLQHGPTWTKSPETHQLPSTHCDLDLKDYLDKLYKTKKSEELQCALNTVLMEDIAGKEILTTLLSLPDSYPQTPDGLPVLFYQHFACHLTDYLQVYFNQVLSLKPFTDTFNESLIHKCSFPKPALHHACYHDHNYCETSLLVDLYVFNVDYTILSSILAKRLNSILDHLLNPGQSKSGGLTVQNCIMATEKVHSCQTQMLAVTLKMDPGEVKWPYLFQRLKSYNLPIRFRAVLKSLVTTGKSYSEECLNSPLSPLPSRGLRIGCPLTPVLVRLCLQPLILSINGEERLQGVLVEEGKVVKAMSKSDTAVIFLTNPGDAVEVFEDTLTEFLSNSGLTVDDTHSELLSIGFQVSSLRSETLKRFKLTSHGFWHQGYFVQTQQL